MLTDTKSRLLDGLEHIEPDALLQLMVMARDDERQGKIDAGVGVFKTSEGKTPVMRAIKEAEKRLHEEQDSKAYLGMAGDKLFPKLLAPIVFGEELGDNMIGLQTPGGCGALTLAFKLVEAARPQARVFVGTPTWANHQPLIAGADLEIIEYPYYDKADTSLCWDAMVEALKSARSGDVALLHGCCHNPTGANLTVDQWHEVAAILVDRGVVPVIDIAYQGLGVGLEEDAAGLRIVMDACPEVIVAQSCDKNFGVYRDRVGALFVKASDAKTAALTMKHIQQIAREMWSMPPDHGAALVRIVLSDPELTAMWRAELDEMRGRIIDLRRRVAESDPRLAYIGEQEGMFSMLPVTPEQVVKLREEHAIYVANNGRFNVCGMGDDQVDSFTNAVRALMDG
ncbi:MAG: aspartate/tyrosine/aromatic aminotransferase [Sphingomonas sp.]|nr:aspartate/tyrosine/aromatic aminotransferase [Sphingomonas sp.]RZV53292.1 MAG: aspartate/tyrosine/aromatic aminotransferase [Sphingomonadaceae bacterium]